MSRYAKANNPSQFFNTVRRCNCPDCWDGYGPRPWTAAQEQMLLRLWRKGQLKKQPIDLTYHEAEKVLHRYNMGWLE